MNLLVAVIQPLPVRVCHTAHRPEVYRDAADFWRGVVGIQEGEGCGPELAGERGKCRHEREQPGNRRMRELLKFDVEGGARVSRDRPGGDRRWRRRWHVAHKDSVLVRAKMYVSGEWKFTSGLWEYYMEMTRVSSASQVHVCKCDMRKSIITLLTRSVSPAGVCGFPENGNIDASNCI